MNKLTKLLLLLIFIPMMQACGKSEQSSKETSVTNNKKTSQQLPTATEVFHLRSECAKLGEKILSNNVIGIALTQSQVSYYNPKTNRCYVELAIHTADFNLPPNKTYANNVLFDGQTAEMIAFATNKMGVTNGLSFKVAHVGYDEVLRYIAENMNDDDYFQK